MNYPGILQGHFHRFKMQRAFGSRGNKIIGLACKCGKKKIAWGWDDFPHPDSINEAIEWRDE